MRVFEFEGCRLYHADCFDVLPLLEHVDALVADPPYGKSYKVNARGPRNCGLKTDKFYPTPFKPAIKGDDRPYDPQPLLAYRKVAIFGANHMNGLPAGGRWIVWDKRRDSRPDSHSDAELVWTNVPGADRIHRQKWRGIIREGEENTSRSRKLHQNQKPVALLDFIFDQIGIKPGATVCDPYMGSGSTGIVALRRGNPFVGIELDATHFETACDRLLAEWNALAADRRPRVVARPARSEPAGDSVRAK